MAKLLIICGHGDGDSGAVGYGYSEASLVRKLGKKIKELGGDDVILGTTSINWYKSGKMNTVKLAKGTQILELHMDSSTSKSAKGGHVIINGKYSADKYDKALAKMISKKFEGRANSLVKRTDLYNMNVAGKRGFSYRLMECGFISNINDVEKFVDDMDDIAEGILQCFNIPVKKSNTYVAQMNMNMRSVPNFTTSRVVEVVRKGAVLSGVEVEGSWLKTTYKKKTGYVRIKGDKTYLKKM
jgi:N-acetylmuramoyl-L-alanine amidase